MSTEEGRWLEGNDERTERERKSEYFDENNKLVEREAGAYQYLTDKFEIIHTTSVPMTDDEALEYFSIVQLQYPTVTLQYITRRGMNEYKFAMMPFQYDKETGEVKPIAGA